eukprot:scaffold23507_cov63-Phaeocystis_antarctica.AAC.2
MTLGCSIIWLGLGLRSGSESGSVVRVRVRVRADLHDLDLALDVVHVLHLALINELDGHLLRHGGVGVLRRLCRLLDDGEVAGAQLLRGDRVLGLQVRLVEEACHREGEGEGWQAATACVTRRLEAGGCSVCVRRSAATFDGRLAEEAWEPRRAGATQPRPSATSLGCTPQLHGATVQGGPTTVPSAERVRRALPLPAVRAAKGREAVAGGGDGSPSGHRCLLLPPGPATHRFT